MANDQQKKRVIIADYPSYLLTLLTKQKINICKAQA